jgi:hypothetical protein
MNGWHGARLKGHWICSTVIQSHLLSPLRPVPYGLTHETIQWKKLVNCEKKSCYRRGNLYWVPERHIATTQKLRMNKSVEKCIPVRKGVHVLWCSAQLLALNIHSVQTYFSTDNHTKTELYIHQIEKYVTYKLHILMRQHLIIMCLRLLLLVDFYNINSRFL